MDNGDKVVTNCKLKFRILYPQRAFEGPIDGRVLLIVSDDESKEPRFQINNYPDTQLIFGVDVDALKPEEEAVIDCGIFGYPLRNISEIPPGEYWVQALLHVYETFHRSDGFTLKLPMDRGEGQKWNMAPGNLYSTPVKMWLDPSSDETIEILLDNIIPPFPEPEDTKYIKHVRIQSKLLTEFWGRPMHLGAVVLLPWGWEEHPEARYPVMIWHGHFNHNLYAPGFREVPPDPDLEPEPYPVGGLYKNAKDYVGRDVPKDRRFYEEYNRFEQEYAYKFYKDWTSPRFPRMILVCIQHATQFFDDSYAVNSANMGPWGDAINYELIPYIEEKFRGIGEGWARVMYGGSTGGWEALAVQVFYPDYYNGCWAISPDPIDFRAFTLVNIYEDENAYYIDSRWKRTPRPRTRSTVGESICTLEEVNHKELVLGTKGRSGGQRDVWLTLFGPVREDGYPKHVWDKMTGKIDRSVAEYMRENWDLRHIMERDWKELGPKLKGKIRIFVGDMDNSFLNNAVYLMEEFLESTKDPYYDGVVEYGDRYGHCWFGDNSQPYAISRLTVTQQLAPQMREHLLKTAPPGADTKSWIY